MLSSLGHRTFEHFSNISITNLLFQINAVAGSTLLLKTNSNLIRSAKTMCVAAHRVSLAGLCVFNQHLTFNQLESSYNPFFIDNCCVMKEDSSSFSKEQRMAAVCNGLHHGECCFC